MLLLLASCSGSKADDAPSADADGSAAGASSMLAAPIPDSIYAELQELVGVLDSVRQANPAEYETYRRQLVLNTQMLLGRLGFGAGPFTAELDDNTRRAIERYQRARGIRVNGDPLDPATLYLINEDRESLKKRTVDLLPPTKLFGDSQWADGYLSASGPWVTDGQSPGTMQKADISCDRARAECELLIGRVVTMFRNKSLDMHEETYPITHWDTDEILAGPVLYLCARYTMRVNRQQQTVTTTRTLRTNPNCTLEARDVVSRLVEYDEEHARLRTLTDSATALMQMTDQAREVHSARN